MTQADTIRAFVLSRYVQPARARGDPFVTVRAGEVHAAMGFDNRIPAVCSALDADKFSEMAGVILVRRSGPRQGSTAEWVFGL